MGGCQNNISGKITSVHVGKSSFMGFALAWRSCLEKTTKINSSQAIRTALILFIITETVNPLTTAK